MKLHCSLPGRLLILAALLVACIAAGAQAPVPDQGFRAKSALELRLEKVIDDVYRRCFRSYYFGGRRLALRIPFGQSGERPGSPGFRQRIFLNGKGEPEAVWEQAEGLFRTEAFADYLNRLREGGLRVVSFDLERKSAAVYRDSGLFRAVAEGPYPGTRTRIHLLKTDGSVGVPEIYDYLYCVGSLGMDCSGFVTCVQRAVARACGADLDLRPAESLGLWFYDPGAGYTEQVDDRIVNLRPGDIVLFRGRTLTFRHSAVIQSVDPAGGVIRYLQCTDWAPREERGVHESFIYFDPDRPQSRLSDDACVWTQELSPAFPGEPGLRYWRNDGDRYRSYQAAGGSVVVRIRALKHCIEADEPGFFRNPSASNADSGS